VGRHFHIYTNLKSLKSLLAQTIQTLEQQKWAFKLQGFQFDIFYKPGPSNLVADALSRKFSDTSASLLAVTSTVPAIIQYLRDYYSANKTSQELVAKSQEDEQMKDKYRFTNGLLYFKGRLFIPQVVDLHCILLQEFYSTPTAGHSGLKPTLACISASFTWPGIYKDTKTFIQQCTVCQHNKYLPQKKKGLRQTLPPPNQVCEELTMDFITHLPKSFGHTAIWVICDRLTKYVHFLALPSH